MFKWLQRNSFIILILGGGAIAISFFQNKENYIKEYNDKIEALNIKIDSLHTVNEKLDEESVLLREKIDDYNIKIDELNILINVIKNETQQQVDIVDSFGDDELEKFFTERYQSQIDN